MTLLLYGGHYFNSGKFQCLIGLNSGIPTEMISKLNLFICKGILLVPSLMHIAIFWTFVCPLHHLVNEPTDDGNITDPLAVPDHKTRQ